MAGLDVLAFLNGLIQSIDPTPKQTVLGPTFLLDLTNTTGFVLLVIKVNRNAGLPFVAVCSAEVWTSRDDEISARARRTRTLMHGKAGGHGTQC